MISKIESFVESIPPRLLWGGFLISVLVFVVSPLFLGAAAEIYLRATNQKSLFRVAPAATEAQRDFAYTLRQAYKYRGTIISTRAKDAETFEISISSFNAEYFQVPTSEFTESDWLKGNLRRLGCRELIVEDAQGRTVRVKL